MTSSENLKKALEQGLAGMTGLSDEDYERLEVTREDLETLASVYINQQYQIAIIVDTLISYPSLIRKIVGLTRDQKIKTISLANTNDSQKPFIKPTGNCAYLYIR